MQITQHTIQNISIAEITSDELLIQNTEDGLELMGNMYYQGFDCVLIKKENITPEFFDLQNGMAGEILQKFSTYRMRLAIVGDFSIFTSSSLKDFIYESNKGRKTIFVGSIEEAIRLITHESDH